MTVAGAGLSQRLRPVALKSRSQISMWTGPIKRREQQECRSSLHGSAGEDGLTRASRRVPSLGVVRWQRTLGDESNFCGCVACVASGLKGVRQWLTGQRRRPTCGGLSADKILSAKFGIAAPPPPIRGDWPAPGIPPCHLRGRRSYVSRQESPLLCHLPGQAWLVPFDDLRGFCSPDFGRALELASYLLGFTLLPTDAALWL